MSSEYNAKSGAGDRTTVSIARATKERMDRWRATGQCYDNFLCQIMSLWEQTHKSKKLPDLSEFGSAEAYRHSEPHS